MDFNLNMDFVLELAISGVRKLELATFGGWEEVAMKILGLATPGMVTFGGGDILNMDFNLNMDFVLELVISGVGKLEMATFGGWEELAMKLILGLAIPVLVVTV